MEMNVSDIMWEIQFKHKPSKDYGKYFFLKWFTWQIQIYKIITHKKTIMAQDNVWSHIVLIQLSVIPCIKLDINNTEKGDVMIINS